MSIIGHKGIQVLSNINSVDDLPEVADVKSEAVWYIESGDLAPDYIAPSLWDGQQFNHWISLVDGEVLVDIPDSVVHHYDASQDERSLGSVSSIPDLVGSIALDDGTEVTLTDNGINSVQSYDTDGVEDYLLFDGNTITTPWTFIAVLRVRSSDRQMMFDHGGGGFASGDGGFDFIDPENDIRYGNGSSEIQVNDFNAVNNTFVTVIEQTSSNATLRFRDPTVVEDTAEVSGLSWNNSVIDFFRDSRDQRYIDSFQAEIAVADSGFDSELQDFEDDLVGKWGINE